jgi:hypothetical protein
VGLVHDPEVETWEFSALKWAGEPVRRVGINLGAPGDRQDGNGTLWLDWPSVGGESPELPVSAEPLRPPRSDVVPLTNGAGARSDAAGQAAPPGPETFRLHSSELSGGELRWVAASGLRNVQKLSVDLGKGPERSYTVRLHFCEPDDLAPGERVFDVDLQGRAVLAGLDVAREAGGARRALVREFRGVRVSQLLHLSFRPARKSAGAVISGVEAVLEE